MNRGGVAWRNRSVLNWGVRGATALVAGWLAFMSVNQSLAAAIRKGDPARAHALASGDAVAAASLAIRLSGPDATRATRLAADDLARAALRGDPTVVSGVATLGINTQIRGDVVGARRIFAYAQRLSRRELLTELWSIEDAVGRGDVREALRHYDIALRTSRQAPGVLFPVLASALGEAPIRTELTRTLASKPEWSQLFIPFVAGNGSDPGAVARLFTDLRRARVAVPEDASAVLISRLADAGQPELAWRYYAVIRPGALREGSRDPRFAASPAIPTIFDWVANTDGSVTASLQPARDGGTISFSVPTGVGGLLMRQVQMLPPADYRLVGHSAGVEGAPDTRPYWELACGGGAPLGRLVLPASAQAGGQFSGTFRVPSGCAMQHLSLVARATDAPAGLSGQIDRVALTRIR